MRKALGFTLVELLIAISIVAILSTIGVITYSQTQKSSKDVKRKADIDSISKVYEEQAFDSQTVSYRVLTASDFTRGGIPTPPEGGNYIGLISSVSSSFRICAILEGGTTSDCNEPISSRCYCRRSSQGIPQSTPGP